MNKEEYDKRLKALSLEFEKKEKELAREYAFANNPYKVGDILQDHYQIIKVESIEWANTYQGLPECVYLGVQLTVKLEPRKRQDDKPRMFQSNVKQKLNND